MSSIHMTGVIHTLKVGNKRADIIVMIPVHAGNPDEYLVRFDGPFYNNLANAQRFKTIDGAKTYATKILFGGTP